MTVCFPELSCEGVDISFRFVNDIPAFQHACELGKYFYFLHSYLGQHSED